MNETIIDGPLATYRGRVTGFDPYVGPDGAVIVTVMELIEITDRVPEWAIHPAEKVGRACRFSPGSVRE